MRETLTDLGRDLETVFSLVEPACQHEEQQSYGEQDSGGRFWRGDSDVVKGGLTRKIAQHNR